MSRSSHPLFRSEEEYQAHIVEQIKIERALPPKPPKTIPDIEYERGIGGWLMVHIYPLNPRSDDGRVWTDDEIRKDTPGTIEWDFSFFKDSWRKHRRAVE